MVDPSNWRIRATAAEALLKMKADTARPYLIKALSDTVEIVRGRAARALVNIADSTELETLILPLMNDPSQIVRYQIQIGLGMRAIDSIAPFIADGLLRERKGYTYDLLRPLAAKIIQPVQRKRLVDGFLADTDPKYRAEGARLAIAWQDLELLERVVKLIKAEKNSAVLFQIYRAIKLQKTLKEMRHHGPPQASVNSSARPLSFLTHRVSRPEEPKPTLALGLRLFQRGQLRKIG